MQTCYRVYGSYNMACNLIAYTVMGLKYTVRIVKTGVYTISNSWYWTQCSLYGAHKASTPKQYQKPYLAYCIQGCSSSFRLTPISCCYVRQAVLQHRQQMCMHTTPYSTPALAVGWKLQADRQCQETAEWHGTLA